MKNRNYVKTLNVFGPSIEGLLGTWQYYFEHTTAKVLCYWANFHCCERPKLNKPSIHLVTLVPAAAVKKVLKYFSILFPVKVDRLNFFLVLQIRRNQSELVQNKIHSRQKKLE